MTLAAALEPRRRRRTWGVALPLLAALLLTPREFASASAAAASATASPAGVAPAATLPQPVALAADALGLPRGGISLWVQTVGALQPLVSVNADVPRNPASAMKLVTTFAVLEALGPAYTWDTEVFLDPPDEQGRVTGNAWIRGLGDPYLVAEEFWLLADGLRKRGVQRIDGDLVFDSAYFDLPDEDSGAFDAQPNRVYNLPPHPLLVNFNAVRFVVRPQADGHSVAVAPDPALGNLEIDNRLRLYSGPCGGYQRGVALAVEDPQVRDRVLLEGRFPSGCSEYSLTRTVLRPESYAFGLFDVYWRQLGGEIGGGWRSGRVPERLAEPFEVHRSRPLGEIVRLVNKFSNNVMTRLLALTLGAETYGPPATTAKGHDAVLAVLESRGVDVRGLIMSNSAGLSRDSRISARQLGQVLDAAWRSPYMPEYVSSLAIPGLDGTMRSRLLGSPAQGRMHMKTGSLDEVSTVAGYVLTRDGERLLLVAMVNAPDAHRGLGEDLQDEVLRWAVTL